MFPEPQQFVDQEASMIRSLNDSGRVNNRQLHAVLPNVLPLTFPPQNVVPVEPPYPGDLVEVVGDALEAEVEAH